MRPLDRALVLARSWFRSRRLDAELSEELDFHIQLEAESNRRAGMPPAQALRAARLSIGHVDSLREISRDQRPGEGARQVLRDVSYGWRLLRKAPAFTLSAVFVLALGIGATTAIFSLVDATLLRPLPFPQADRLVKLFELTPANVRSRVSLNNFQDWAAQSHSFTAIAAAGYTGTSTVSNGAAVPETISTLGVTASFFDVLGVKPVAGRTFRPEELDESSVVMISERIWRSVFAGDPTLVGRGISIGGGPPLTVVGIVPAGFQLLNRADVWMLLPRADTTEMRRLHSFDVIARLKPGATLRQARADMAVVADDIARAWPETNKDWKVAVEPLQRAIVSDDLRSTALVLLGGAMFILLMACANVANLLLAKGVSRTRELGVRSALGAGRSRLVRQLLTESLVLSSLGGAGGVALAWLIVRAAPSLVPAGTIPLSVALHVDWRLLTFAIAVTAATALASGVVPAWHATRVPLVEVMGSGGRTLGGGGRTRAVLAVLQIAAALLLVTGAGLFVRTIVALNNVNAGYRAEGVVTMAMNLPSFRYPTPARLLSFYQAVEREVSTLPGVRAAAFISGDLPLDGYGTGQYFHVQGTPVPDPANQPVAHYQMITPSYFAALGIPLVQGRAFTTADTDSSTPVCIVNEAFVRQYLGGRDPLGASVTVRSLARRTSDIVTVNRQIVGVIRQVTVRPAEQEPEVELYVPLAQNPWMGGKLVVRAEGNAASLVPAIRSVVAQVDKDMPLTRIRTMEDVATEATAPPRFRAQLVGAFAAFALAIAGVGLYGVLSFLVRQRAREFSVRMALGARPADVVRLVMTHGLKLGVVGVALGALTALIAVRSLSTLLFGVEPMDASTFAAACAVLLVVTIAACTAPALLATHADPASTLRQE